MMKNLRLLAIHALMPLSLCAIKQVSSNSLQRLKQAFSSDIALQKPAPKTGSLPKPTATIDKNLAELIDDASVYAKAKELSKYGFGQWALVRNFIDKIAVLNPALKVMVWNHWVNKISLSDPGFLDMCAIMSSAVIEAIVPDLISEKTLAEFAKNPWKYDQVSSVLSGGVDQQELFSQAITHGIAALPLALFSFLTNDPANITSEVLSIGLPGNAQILAISNSGEYVAWLDSDVTEKKGLATLYISKYKVTNNQVRQVQQPIAIKSESPEAHFFVSFTESNGQVLVVETAHTTDISKQADILFYNLDLQRAFAQKVEKYQLTHVNTAEFKDDIKDLVIKASNLSNCKKIIALGFSSGLVQIYENNDTTNVYELFKSYTISKDEQFVSLTYNDYDQSLYINAQKGKKFSIDRYLILSSKGTVFEKMAHFDTNGFMFLTLFGKDLIAVQEDNSTPTITVLSGMNGAVMREIKLINNVSLKVLQKILTETKNYGPFFDRSKNVLSIFREKISNKSHTLYQVALQAPVEFDFSLDQALLIYSAYNNFLKNTPFKICNDLKKIYEGLPAQVKSILKKYVELCK